MKKMKKNQQMEHALIILTIVGKLANLKKFASILSLVRYL